MSTAHPFIDMLALGRDLRELRRRLPPDTRPVCAAILGSGWSAAADRFPARAAIPYAEIPSLGTTGIAGHSGTLKLVTVAGCDMLLFLGRRHWYEGVGWTPVALPVYLAHGFGVSRIVLTNAAGGIAPDFQVGDLMWIRDHINLMGVNPLHGPHHPVWGARFPAMTAVYNAELLARGHACAAAHRLAVREGVYVATAGPSYETPAEIRMFAALGAHAVGMSTVPEAILAHAAGLQVIGLSCITNVAAGLGGAVPSHADVIEATQRARPRMEALLQALLIALAERTASQ